MIIISGGPAPKPGRFEGQGVGPSPWGGSVWTRPNEWRDMMEAVAKQHDWDAPSGYNLGNWPPFSIGG